jgi:hypothetical protein
MTSLTTRNARKTTVETCVGVDAKILAQNALDAGFPVCNGRLQVGLAFSGHDAERLAGGTFSLVLLPSNVGRHRWWFECPGCVRQVQTLYRTPTGSQLFCRHCHDLTYRSAQRHDKRVDYLRRHPEALEKLLNVSCLPLRKALLAYRAAVAPPIRAHTR